MNIDYLSVEEQDEFRRMFPEEFASMQSGNDNSNVDILDNDNDGSPPTYRGRIRSRVVDRPIEDAIAETVVGAIDSPSNPRWLELLELSQSRTPSFDFTPGGSIMEGTDLLRRMLTENPEVAEAIEDVNEFEEQEEHNEEEGEEEEEEEADEEITEEETEGIITSVNLEQAPEEAVAPQYGRFKGLSWFNTAKQQQVTLAGLGGIGSYVNLFISRIGPSQLFLFDPDLFESHNMSGQLVRSADIGSLKVQVAHILSESFSRYYPIVFSEPYTDYCNATPVMICGFDNMAARKVFYSRWKAKVSAVSHPEECFFIDGRLLAEEYQILCFTGDNTEAQRIYERDFLFDDSEVADAECTQKQTSHYAGMIAAQMVGYFTNFCNNLNPDNSPRLIPYYTSYNGPLAIYDTKYT